MSDIRDQLKSAIYGQESSSGKADTSQENYAGARGPMQVTKSTFEGLKGKGLIPTAWDHANPEHTKAAGNILIDTLADKYGDDPRKVAAAYYAGEKAVRADGTIADFRDKKNANAPTTLQYVSQVLNRMGVSTEAAQAGVSPVTKIEAFDVKNWDQQRMPAKIAKAKTPLYDAPVPNGDVQTMAPLAVPTESPIAAQQAAAQANDQKATEEYEKSTWLDRRQNGWMHNGMLGSALKELTRRKEIPVPGFNPRVQGIEAYAGKTEADQLFLDDAVSPHDLELRKAEIEQRNDGIRAANLHGTGDAILGAIFEGLPEGIFLGFGATKAFQLANIASAARLASQGRKWAALGAEAAQGAVGNVVPLAVQDQWDHYVGVEDYGMQASFGVLFAGLHYQGIGRAVEGAQMKALGQKMMEEASIRVQATRAKAIDNLGEGPHTPEALAAEVARLEAESIHKDVAAVTAPVTEDRVLLPRELFEPPKAKAVAPSGDPALTTGPNGAQVPSGQQRFGESALYNEEEARKALKFAGIGPDEMRAELAKVDKIATGEAQAKAKTPIEMQAAVRFHGEKPVWDKFGDNYDLTRIEHFKSGRTAAQVAEVEGVRVSWLLRQAPGLHVLTKLAENSRMKPVIEAARSLASQFLPDSRIAFGIDEGKIGNTGVRERPTHDAIVYSAGSNHIIGVRDNLGWHDALTGVIHELGHAIFHENARHIPAELLGRMVKEHGEFLADLRAGKASARLKRSSEGSASAFNADGSLKGKMANLEYNANFDEYTAESFVRYVQKKAREGGGPELPKSALDILAQAWEKIKEFYTKALDKGYLSKDEAFHEFFDRVLKGTLKQEQNLGQPEFLDAGLVLPQLSQKSHGLDTIPEKSVQQQAEKQAITSLYAKAVEWAKINVIDNARLKSLTDNSVFNVASTGLLMLKSKNPVMRMVASELVESASGATGRKDTAAIGKYINERAYMGNTINEVQSAYTIWRNSQGGNVFGDIWDGKLKQHFDRLVAQEIESRRPGATRIEAPEAVVKAADSYERAYTRMRTAQVEAKTIGWASLPATSVGYMPHRMSPEKARTMTDAERGALHTTLVDQFINIEGFDITFSAHLANQYIDRIQSRALGGYETASGIHQVGAADVVEEALGQMGLSREQIREMMKKYVAGGAGHTKRRLQLDLNAEHDNGAGGTFRLLDLFETDQLKLLRGQAGRVSGEVALARHGVMGKPGLKLLRKAMEYGADGEKTTPQEMEAFDQVAAELLSEPFGTAGGKWLDRAMTTNSLARLGGMGFTQFAEFINGFAHIGVAGTLDAVGGMVRLRAEAKALARGEKVDNPILSSVEIHGGAEFGTDAYKIVFPFDNGNQAYQTYGKDTLTFADRALRGASHVQAKLSMWRSIHSAQQRGMAEQIIHKAVKYVRGGVEDKALADMGFTADVRAAMRESLADIATFDANGNLARFDITKMADTAAANQFVQAVHRGTSQIIQGTFIGETGKWAHNDYLKLMTQFRSFSITSVEKQWARQVGNHGTGAVIGLLLGSMAAAAPIYIARTLLASQGRPDREAYLEKQLSAAQIARATMNYVALTGLTGDMLDALTAVSGAGTVTGGRSNAGSQFVGNVVAPAAGLVDDLWRGIQNTKAGTDPSDLVKNLPFAKLPFLAPAINSFLP
jgi:hypothetical protein